MAEPIYVERQSGMKPIVHLLADHGYSTYSTLILTHRDTVATRSEVVRRFVEASILGWVNYLYGDRRAANARMIADNPEMTVAEIEAAVSLMREQGIVDSGEALTAGIGAMNVARVADFYQQMVEAGLYAADEVELSALIDTRFVNQGAGLDLKRQLLGTAKDKANLQ